MNKEFVPYEQALALKELGFESPYPIGGYQGGKVFYYENGELHYDGRPMYSSDSHSGQLLAPLYQQAFRWFREKYKIFSSIMTEYSYGGTISAYHINGLHQSDISKGDFYTYEEAELACLIKLIKLVKNK